jgi:hypothetical protein
MVFGTPGVLVHAKWTIRNGYIAPRKVWPELIQYGFESALIVHYVQDIASSVDIVFSGMDDPAEVGAAIAAAFHCLVENIERYDPDDDSEQWEKGVEYLDPRCHINDAFARAARLWMFSIFGARGDS